jgi:hypothetical protein
LPWGRRRECGMEEDDAMSKDLLNLIAFGLTIAAGVICLSLGHETIGGALLTGAVFHAVPSPFNKRPETESTPGIERAEAEENQHE